MQMAQKTNNPASHSANVYYLTSRWPLSPLSAPRITSVVLLCQRESCNCPKVRVHVNYRLAHVVTFVYYVCVFVCVWQANGVRDEVLLGSEVVHFCGVEAHWRCQELAGQTPAKRRLRHICGETVSQQDEGNSSTSEWFCVSSVSVSGLLRCRKL